MESDMLKGCIVCSAFYSFPYYTLCIIVDTKQKEQEKNIIISYQYIETAIDWLCIIFLNK